MEIKIMVSWSEPTVGFDVVTIDMPWLEIDQRVIERARAFVVEIYQADKAEVITE